MDKQFKKEQDNKLELIKNHLYKLGNSEVIPYDSNDGMCCEILKVFGVRVEDRLFSYWKGYSGDECYTVSHEEFRPSAAFYYHHKINRWDKNTAYGKARLGLCIWLADEIAKGNVVIEDNYLIRSSLWRKFKEFFM